MDFKRTVVQYLLTEDPDEKAAAECELRRYLTDANRPPMEDAEVLTRQILVELGVPEHLNGHAYLVYAVVAMIHRPSLRKEITKVLYPETAKVFDTTASRVERGIRHAVEVVFERGDYETLWKIFGATVSIHKSKATNLEFLTRVSNVVRQRMEGAY